ncbi:hypothetical protein [Actinoplanes sp. NPDC051494]|uniref:hypothetical protein n=1 Tax=Actinoplanes sp. NPDC051494 TaxID=3363907 RepID=UPI003794B0B3
MGLIEVSDGYREEDFEADGSLRDVCVLGVDLSVWDRLVQAAVKAPWDYQFDVNGEPCRLENFSVRGLFVSKGEGDDVSARLGIRVGKIWFYCFFFDLQEIEFSFDPAELEGGQQFGSLEQFMIWLAETCDRRVVVTMETFRHDEIPALIETVKRGTQGP